MFLFNFIKFLRSTELRSSNTAVFKLVHFSKNLIVCSSAGPTILSYGSHCSANFQPILDCFIPNFKLKYEDSQNIKVDRVSTVVFNLHQIKRRAFFFGGGIPGIFIQIHPVESSKLIQNVIIFSYNFISNISNLKIVAYL